jgi:hypothetical protein
MRTFFAILALTLMPAPVFAVAISPEIEKLLHEAVDTKNFFVRIVEQSEIHSKQAIILLSENHIKSNLESNRIGKAIAEQFDLIGLEGPPYHKLHPDHLSSYMRLHNQFSAWLRSSDENIALVNSGQGELMHLIRPEIKNSVEALMYTYLSVFDFRNFDVRGFFGLIESEWNNNQNLRNWAESAGITEDLIAQIQLDINSLSQINVIPGSLLDMMELIREKLYLNRHSKKEIVELEKFFPLPENVEAYNNYAGKFFKVCQSCSALTSVGLCAYLMGDRVGLPQSAKTGLITSAVLSVPIGVAYLCGKFNPVLPSKLRVPVKTQREFKASDERDLIMATTLGYALRSRPHKKLMLAVVGFRHLPGIVNYLASDFGYKEVAFPFIKSHPPKGNHLPPIPEDSAEEWITVDWLQPNHD